MMETCKVTPDNNIIDYVCGLKSKGGILRKPGKTPLPPPPPPPLVVESSSFVNVDYPLPPPPPSASNPSTSEFMSSSSITSGEYTDYEHDDDDAFAQPETVDGITIHHYPQPYTLTVPGTDTYANHQLVPSTQKVNTVLPPLIPLIQSYQGKAMKDMERLIQQLEYENARIATTTD
jgi:hypothetical protein